MACIGWQLSHRLAFVFSFVFLIAGKVDCCFVWTCCQVMVPAYTFALENFQVPEVAGAIM